MNSWCGIYNQYTNAKKTEWNDSVFSNDYVSTIRNDFLEVRCPVSQKEAGMNHENNNYIIFYSGYFFSKNSQDTKSIIIELYQKYDVDFVKYLSGHFSLVLFDKLKNILILAVDKYGVGAINFGKIGNLINFSNSLKLFNSNKLEIDPQAIFYYLDFHVIPQPYSIYKEIKKLQPGEMVLFTQHGYESRRYNQLDYQEISGSEQKLLAELKATQENAIRDVCSGLELKHTGAFLSGGIDSSSVVGALTNYAGAGVNTFSIGFEEEQYNELPYSRIAVNHFQAIPHEYIVNPKDVFEVIEKIVAEFGEPFGNSSALPTYFCAKLAKENSIQTLFAGDGGDELFGGNERYLKDRIFNMYSGVPRIIRRLLLERPLDFINHKTKLSNKIRNFITRANLKNPERFFTDDSFGSKYLSKLYEQEFLNKIDINGSLHYLQEIYNEANAESELNKLLYIDMRLAIAGNDLYKVRTMCNSVGVEARFPMLHPSVVDYSLALPTKMKLKMFKKRYLYRKYLEGFVPDEIINKKKHGFGLPISVWLRENDEVQTYFKDNLLSDNSKLAGIVRRDFIEDLLIEHQKGLWNNASYLWVLLILELWLRAYDKA